MYIGFVYEWVNLVNNRKYIGKHKGHIDDGYVGSGKAFRAALKKYSKHNFHRNILEYVYEESELAETERKYLIKFACAKSQEYYNLTDNISGCIGKQNYEHCRERMRKDNPNKNGKSRNAYIIKHGKPPSGRKSKISDIEKKLLSERMVNDNPCKNISPWEHPQATQQSLIIWKNALAYYKWWCDNKDKSYSVMAKVFGYDKWTVSHANMIKKFRNGWIPDKDTKWLKNNG